MSVTKLSTPFVKYDVAVAEHDQEKMHLFDFYQRKQRGE